MFKEKPYHPSDAYFIKGVEARTSSVHGVGVFAARDIKNKEVFEVSPVLLFTPFLFRLFHEETETRHVQENYVFWWEPGKLATAWGYASLYNHANGSGANAGYRLRKTESPALEIYASRDIKKGEEICLHYMHHRFDLEFGPSGEWWDASESDMTSAIAGFDTSAAALLSDAKKNYR